MRWWVSKSGGRCFARGIGERLVCRAASSCRGSDELVERLRISAASSSTLRAPRVSISLPGCSPKVDCRGGRTTPANVVRRACTCRWHEGDSHCVPSFGQAAGGFPVDRTRRTRSSGRCLPVGSRSDGSLSFGSKLWIVALLPGLGAAEARSAEVLKPRTRALDRPSAVLVSQRPSRRRH